MDKKKQKKIMIIAGIVIGVLVLIYLFVPGAKDIVSDDKEAPTPVVAPVEVEEIPTPTE